ncbi:MAG: hypothetical protein PW792_06080 [Acidobacteriaceae bacterium]|nr:hypothetical protein [Acidobacteriaceae bacterium]
MSASWFRGPFRDLEANIQPEVLNDSLTSAVNIYEQQELSGFHTTLQTLPLAALEGGKMHAETFAPVSIKVLCESIIEDANFEASGAGSSIVGERQDLTLFAYPDVPRRAIEIVLRNAIRYAPMGSTIQVECMVDLSARKVIRDILDHGPGVPEAMLPTFS